MYVVTLRASVCQLRMYVCMLCLVCAVCMVCMYVLYVCNLCMYSIYGIVYDRYGCMRVMMLCM